MSNFHVTSRRKIEFLKKKFFTARLETGFSMLEAVVVVGVLLALAISGFIAYGSITENAKTAKLKSAASEIHTGVLVASIDGDTNTKPEDVIRDWNASTDKIQVKILEPKTGDDFCIKAFNPEDPTSYALDGDCSGSTGDGTGGDPGGTSPADIDGDGIPNSSDPDIDGDGIPNASDPTPNGETGGTGTGNETGAATARTISFTPITNYANGDDPELIKYMNTELKYAALSVETMSWDEVYATPEYIAWDTEYPTDPEKYANYRNIVGRADDASISAKRAATDAAQSAYDDNPNEATHRTYVDAMNDYYLTAAAATRVVSLPMLPGAPGEFDNRTIAAGSTDSIIVSYKTPPGLINASNMSSFGSYEVTDIDNQTIYGSNILTVTPENGSYLLSIEVLAPAGGWPAGDHKIVVGQVDRTNKIFHYSAIKVTVQ